MFDLQDAGARFYTYETTLGLVLESAKELGLPLVVLDRPNPVGGAVEGPLLDAGRTSFTAYHRTPIRHGMTLGELARLFAAERSPGAQLEVVKMSGYRRDMLFADTTLAWVAPSPNLRTAREALLYPGIALLEGTNVSVDLEAGRDRLRRAAQTVSALLIGLIRPARFSINEKRGGEPRAERAKILALTPALSRWERENQARHLSRPLPLGDLGEGWVRANPTSSLHRATFAFENRDR